MNAQNSQKEPKTRQKGNATIYVLIVVALFAALGIVLSRQTDTSESSHVGNEKADLIAGQILAYPAQVRQAVDMLTMSGTDPSDLDFTQPGQANFNTAPNIKKIFHPDGGGLVLGTLPAESVGTGVHSPAPGWYLGMFNNIEWSKTTDHDVVLVAYQLSQDVCKRINYKLTGSETIPALTDTIPDLLINKEYPTGNVIHAGTNADFTAATCAACNGKPTLCVTDSSNAYGFYSLIVNR
jgi:hypothetical protein